MFNTQVKGKFDDVSETERVVATLQALGLSGYEAKAYLALVGAGRPLNGYEVAKSSGVPRGTVYEALGKLVSRGVAFEARADSGATSYLPLPPETLLRRLRDDFERSFDDLAVRLPAVARPPTVHVSHHVEGRDAVLSRATDLVANASGELYVSAWADDLTTLTPALQAADRRGVLINTVRFGDSPAGPAADVGSVFGHVFARPEVVLDRVGCRLLVVASDRREVLIGATAGGSTWASYSDDPAVVLVAVEFVRHDIGFQVLAERAGVAEVEAVFDADPALRRLEHGRGAPGLARRSARSGPTRLA